MPALVLRRMGWLMLLACWLGLAWGVHAQEPAPSQDHAADAELSELLSRAVAAYDAGDLITARALFEAVHARQPTARTLRSLGLLAYRQKRLADAVAMLEAALASQVRPLTEAQRQGAQAVLHEARTKLELEPPIHSESAPVASSAPPTELAPRPAAVPLTEPTAGPSQAARVSPDKGARSAPDLRLHRTRYALLGVGAGALAWALGSYITAAVRVRDIEDDCRRMDDGQCFDSYVEQRKDEANLDLLRGMALAGTIVGGMAIAGGGLLFLVRPHTDRAHALLQLSYRGQF